MTESTAVPAQPESVAGRYVEFWNAATKEEQRHLAGATFADDITYHTPVGIMHGTVEMIAFRDQFAQHSPDYEFRLRREPDSHHDRARLQWELMVRGESFAAGTDVLEFDDTGRVSAITTFLDRAPEGFDPHTGN